MELEMNGPITLNRTDWF